MERSVITDGREVRRRRGQLLREAADVRAKVQKKSKSRKEEAGWRRLHGSSRPPGGFEE